MIILGIETSCDETAAAVVQDGTTIIRNIVASSQAIHAKYGGIIPENAAREQIKAIIPVIDEAILESGVGSRESGEKNKNSSTTNSELRTPIPAIDAIAVTVGPGLIGSLLVGVETAKTLAFAWNKPLVPVNHLVGHIYANWIVLPQRVILEGAQRPIGSTTEDAIGSPAGGLQHDTKERKLPEFPALVLLVSGGHSELVLMQNHGKFKYLGGTRDDAAGECFDKCARLLDLGYPGGLAIEKAAIKNNLYKLPRPMINSKDFDFSFSGLKTAVANAPKDNPNYLAYELQEAITDVLVTKTRRAAEKYQVKNILLAGGVAANKRLREKFPEALCPPFELCTDNAAYIASAASFNYKPVPWEKVNADPSLSFS